MTLNYMVYHYDGSRNAVAMTDMAGKELVIDFDKGNMYLRKRVLNSSSK